MPQPELSVRLLGGFQLLYCDTPIAEFQASPRLQSAVAYLLLHQGTPIPRSTLAAAFWPEATEARAHGSLRKLLLDLRRTIPEAERFLSIDGATVTWREDARIWADVAAFLSGLREGSAARLEHAVEAYRGDLLPHCYDDWIISHRERLRQAFLDALQGLVAAAERERDYAKAIRYGVRLLQEDPLREETYRDLMRLHALRGDRSGALRVYHACATLLHRELGVPPSEPTREAYERLLVLEVPPSAPLAVPPLVGRRQEWDQLLALWRLAVGGAPRVVMLRGDPGIGKTRLAEEFADWAARQGIATAGARCFAAEFDLPFAPVVALLRSRPLGPLSAPLHHELARLLPELASDDAEPFPANARPEPWQRQRLFEALARALLASQPLLVVVDDLHWCDKDSLEWFHYLSHFAPGARMLFLGTYRPEDLGADSILSSILESWRHAGRLTEVELGPLDTKAAAALASFVVGSPLTERAAARLFRETEGNPLFVMEMARAGILSDDGPLTIPSRVQEVILARLRRLSPPARELAGVAATLGRAVSLPLLAQVTRCDEDTLLRSLDEMWHRRIIREHGGDAYDFSHDKLREVAYGDLSPTWLRILHRQVAEGLLAFHASDPDEVCREVAYHFDRAGLPRRAADYYLRAAQVARRVYAHDAARACYTRLLELVTGRDRMMVMAELGDVCQLTGRWSEAEALYGDALTLAEGDGDLATQARLQTALGDLAQARGFHADALRWLERARQTFEAQDHEPGKARVLSIMGQIHYELGDYPGALACHEHGFAIVQRIGDSAAMARSLKDMGATILTMGEPRRARACLERSLALAVAARDRITEASALNSLGLSHLSLSECTEALQYLERSFKCASEIGHRRAMCIALGNIGRAHEEIGDYQRSLQHNLQALEMATEIGDRRSMVLALWHMGVAYEELGRLPEAQRCFEHQLRIAVEIGHRLGAGMALANQGRLSLKRHDLQEAEGLLSQARTLTVTVNLPFFLCELHYWQGELHFLSAQYAAAETLAVQAMDLAGRAGRRRLLLPSKLLTVRSRLALGQIGQSSAGEDLEQMLTEGPEPRYQALIQYTLWRVTGATSARRAAAALYRQVFMEAPSREARDRHHELTGRNLPRLPGVPPLPEVASTPVANLANLLADAGHLLEARARPADGVTVE